jgi:hypothetical protein
MSALMILWAGNIPHCFIDERGACQHLRFESNIWINLQIVAIAVFSANPCPNPGIGCPIEEVSSSIFEVVDTPDVFKIGEFTLGKIRTEELLNTRTLSVHSLEQYNANPPSVRLI